MTSIIVARTGSVAQAKKFQDIIAKTPSYMDFKVNICPCMGEFTVEAETFYTSDQNEAKDMLQYIMYCALVK
jgi:hypothetical protein